MGWESFGVVRFDLGPFLQSQMRKVKCKCPYDSLLIIPRDLGCETNIIKPRAGNLLVVRFDLGALIQGQMRIAKLKLKLKIASTYLSSSFLVEHKGRHRLLHFGLSIAIFSAAHQSLHPISFLSHSTVLLHVSLGLPLLLFPSDVQVRAVLMLSFLSLLRIWPIYFHLLILNSSSSLVVPVTFCSSLLLMVFGQ